MKKKLLFICMIVVGMTMNAQFTVEDHNGIIIPDGTILEFGVATYPEASWDFFVNNESETEEISMKAQFVSAVNTDGSQVEICFGLCYTGISIGQIFPDGQQTVDIEPGGQTGMGNHIFNTYDGDEVVEYVFKFYQVDEFGEQVGEAVSVTYIYNPYLGTNDNTKLNVSIASTVISNEMVVNTQEEVMMNVYDMLGRKVKSQNLSVGQQVINMAGLSAQAYIVQFNTETGKTSTSKIIVR